MVEVDLAELVAWVKPILTIVLLTIGIVFFIVPWLKDLIYHFVSSIPNILPPVPVPTPKTRNSDAPAPVGIGEFLKTIEETSPNANPSIWWEYAKAEMTEAQVAIAEAKLARRNDCTLTPNTIKTEDKKLI